MESEIIDGKEYRLVMIRGRSKLIAKDGSAINPIRRSQKATFHINQDGYPCFGGGIPVHLYVAKAWVEGYFEGAEVNHKDFNRQNFHADNLEWVSHYNNIQYSTVYNRETVCQSKQGVHNGRATFTEAQVLRIRELYDKGMSIANIVREFYPNLVKNTQYRSIHSTFANICHRKTWKHL